MTTNNRNDKIRNIAIIAHVDHGKTTLVDHLFRQSGTFRENQQVNDRVMDSMDLERERGITISAKNCSIYWKDTKINILDTPGHSDFGGEVERALMMVDGAVLLVDSSEGPLPQTRFVLGKALAARIPIILLINKIDRKDSRPQEVINEVYDLFIDLGADDEQIEFPVLYAIGRDGIAQYKLEEPGTNLAPLLDTIIKDIPGPAFDDKAPFEMVVLNLSYSDYLGQLAIGRVFNGEYKKGMELRKINNGETKTLKATKVQVYDGVALKEVDSVSAGEIVIIAGAEDVKIGDTICADPIPSKIRKVKVDEPTIAMRFSANTSPFSGREGKHVQSQRIKDRLFKETLYNVALKIEETDSPDTIIVKGRGEFQMAILLETMRREGFEVAVGRPQVINKIENGVELEPIELLIIDCDESSVGVITEKLARRKGRMTNLINRGSGRVRLEFDIPSRGLIGYRNEFLTDTRGTGLMNSLFNGFSEYRGEFEHRLTGSLVSDREGEAIPYAIFGLEPRGKILVCPGDPVYEGMIVGEHNKENDLRVNITREKKLTNIRAAGKDENVALTPVQPLSIEKAIEFIKNDELVEITPKSVRMRKMKLT